MAIIDSRVGRREHPRFPGDPSIEQKQQRGQETDQGAIGETPKIFALAMSKIRLNKLIFL